MTSTCLKKLGLLLTLWPVWFLCPGEPTVSWPEITATARPWTYWHWMGSAVDRANLSRELRLFRQAGLGGVHIVPIYGARGYEARYVKYLSPEWMGLLAYTVSEARALGLGTDMTLGTGWNFGGPDLGDRYANANLEWRILDVPPGRPIEERYDPRAVLALIAYSDGAPPVELTGRLAADGKIGWSAGPGGSRVFVVSQRPSGNMVDRAAPGEEGPMLNPFFGEAVRHYLKRFTSAFSGYAEDPPRAFYHDSYEYAGNWSPDLFEQFEKRRGYRLQDQLPSLLAGPQDERRSRVRGDYQETISDLLVESFMPPWVGWAHQRRALARNQAHGSPGNLLDLYAAADIPETEMFHNDRDPLVAKFASSAAHFEGRTLVAAETGTWIAEHFNETLEDLKKLADLLFVSGVNHVFYHGTCYSPADAPWPGWLFYASTQLNPRSSLWRDLPALNAYIGRCQSVLQSGRPGSDVLVYWPIHDLWHSRTELAEQFGVHRRGWFTDQPVGALARLLWQRGFAFDYVSDRQLAAARVSAGVVTSPGSRYQALVVPFCRLMPDATMARLINLAQSGGTVIFESKLPEDVPGFGRLEARRSEFRRAIDGLNFVLDAPTGLRIAAAGSGRILIGDVEAALALSRIPRESLVDIPGLRYVRRISERGWDYFIVNTGTAHLDGWVPLSNRAASVAGMDPMSGDAGFCRIRPGEAGRTLVYLQLDPGESIILSSSAEPRQGPSWRYHKADRPPLQLEGEWRVEFMEGGPALPPPFRMRRLASWTLQGGEAARFAGTARYTLEFELPASGSGIWLLDPGRVCDSARVRINGRPAGTLFMPGTRLELADLAAGRNRIEFEVTNAPANRIRDLDRRGVEWRRFHNINFVDINYKPFDASRWPLRDSGLLGPVRMWPAEPLP